MLSSRVKFSTYSILLTVIVLAMLVFFGIVTDDNLTFYIIFSATFLLVMFALRYAPLRIDVDPERVTIKSPLRKHKIPMTQIKSVELFQPTMASYRLCGSGGFMGYWGIFREADIGKYTAFYGKASDCFIIRLKNGDKYVLGCENPAKIVDYITRRIN